MAIKTPIISIDVDDGAFSRFAALFARYQAQLKQMPGQWKTIGDEVDAVLDKAVSGAEAVTDAAEGTAAAAGAASVSFRQTFIAVGGAAEQLGKVSGASRDAASSARSQASAWHDMARSARSFATQIGDATRSLLRWAGLTGLISGILGAGGLFGIDRLATSAGNARKSALGLGVTPGEESAFGINYSRVLADPNGFLSGVNDALHDVTKRQSLYGAGLSERDLAGKDTGQVSAELIPALKRIADQTPAALLAQVLQSRHLDQFMSLQDFERLKATPASEVAGYGRNYQRDAQALELNQQQLTAWQNLQVQLARAGATIEKVFIVGLSKLAEPIAHLSDAFVQLVQSVMKSDVIGGWVEKLASGIEWLSTNMGSIQFRDSVVSFIKGAEALAEKVGSLLPSLDDIKSFETVFADGLRVAGEAVKAFADAVDTVAKALAAGAHKVVDPWTKGVPPTRDEADQWNRDHPDNQIPDDQQIDGQGDATGWDRLKSWWGGGRFSGPMMHPAAYRTTMGGGGDFGQLEAQNGLPPGLLNAVERQESGGRDVTSPAGAQGYFQFMPATAARYGVNPHDEMSSAHGAANYLRDLMERFHGDVAKAAAGYNWGEGNVEKDIAQYGSKWREHLPAETSAYVNSITSQISNNTTNNHGGGGGRAMITINNATGGNATVSASQLVT